MKTLCLFQLLRKPFGARCLLFWAGALALAWSGCGRGPSASGRGRGANPAPPPPRRVQAAPVTERRLERVVVALGSLLAHDQATLSAKVPGRLQVLKVDLGSQVKAGEVLALIEPRDYELKVEQASAALAQARAVLGLPLEGDNDRVDPDEVSSVKEARAVLQEAKANFDRVTRLAQEKLVSPSETDVAQSAYLVALNRHEDARTKARQQQALVAQRRAEFNLARQPLADAAIVAPFDGGIQSRQADIGEYLTIGSPILELVRLDPLRLRLEVSERDAPRVRAAQAVRFSLEGDPQVHTGQVQRLSPALDEQNRMLLVEADLRNDGRLRPGHFVRAEIVTAPESTAVTIPTNAVSVFAGLQKAFTIQEGKAVEKRITTGQSGGDWVEVTSGLRAGESVVLNPGNLLTGHPVTVEGGSR